MINTQLKEIELNVNITREFYNEGEFHMYDGVLDNPDDIFNEAITLKCDGFELRPGKTKVVGIMNKKYRGKLSFKCIYEKFDSSNYDSQYNLLCSLKGIKDKTAKKILDNIPDHNIEIFLKEVPKIKGVGAKTIKLIHEGLKFLKENSSLMELIGLLGNSISNKKIHDLNEYLINENIEINTFKNDPYFILIEKLEMGFKKVDKIALECLKVNPKLRTRLLYLSEQIVNTVTEFGDTYTTMQNFNQKLESYNLDIKNANEYIDCEDSKVIKIDDDKIQTKLLNKSEINIPLYLDKYKNNFKTSKYEEENIDILINEYEIVNNIKLHETQKEAVILSIKNGVNIITGGGGVGKTTIVKCINFILTKFNKNIIQLAPTGKAARRMSQATNKAAATCHRFIFQSPDLLKSTTLIIDEFSMVDSILFYQVLKTIDESSVDRIILLGDVGQLPSVQAGNVLHDLIESNYYNTIRLTKTFRQAAESNILKIASEVRQNQIFEKIKSKDFFTVFKKDSKEYIKLCWIKKKENINDLDKLFNDFQICTSNKAACEEINKIIQKEQKIIKFLINKKPIEFGLNDKIMCIKNDYKNDIYNGEFGRITSLIYIQDNMEYIIKTNKDLLTFYNSNQKFIKNIFFEVYFSDLNKTIKYELDYDTIENFKLSYCCTIHKLQGSEFDTVLVDLSSFNMITDNRLLYTAITRAKNQCILISKNNDTIDKITKNKISSKRKTLLLDNLNN